jgi:hypothetical protein
MVRPINRLFFTSLELALFRGPRDFLYPINWGLSSTKGIAQKLPMEKLDNCHNVIPETTAGLSGGSAADGGSNNVADRLSQ